MIVAPKLWWFAAPLTNLTALQLFQNHLTSFVLPGGLWNLIVLDGGFNALVYRARSVPMLQIV